MIFPFLFSRDRIVPDIIHVQPEIDPRFSGPGRPEGSNYVGSATCTVAGADWAIGDKTFVMG